MCRVPFFVILMIFAFDIFVIEIYGYVTFTSIERKSKSEENIIRFDGGGRSGGDGKESGGGNDNSRNGDNGGDDDCEIDTNIRNRGRRFLKDVSTDKIDRDNSNYSSKKGNVNITRSSQPQEVTPTTGMSSEEWLTKNVNLLKNNITKKILLIPTTPTTTTLNLQRGNERPKLTSTLSTPDSESVVFPKKKASSNSSYDNKRRITDVKHMSTYSSTVKGTTRVMEPATTTTAITITGVITISTNGNRTFTEAVPPSTESSSSTNDLVTDKKSLSDNQTVTDITFREILSAPDKACPEDRKLDRSGNCRPVA